MKIVKVELLWSRDCPLTCAGCIMPNNHPWEGDEAQWRRAIRNIRSLGSKFVAIYGAEPLTRLPLLPQVIDEIYRVGMKATVITAIPFSKQMRELLDQTPVLDSITCSYDGVFMDRSRKSKSVAGWGFLKDNKNLRDRALVATVTRQNADMIPQYARNADEHGCWFLFDLFHQGTGPLSKCGNHGDESEIFPTIEQVRRMATELLTMKRAGARVHCSELYLQTLIDRYNGKPRELWHCKGQKTGWLTVDCDGRIFPCDDWQVPYPVARIWDDLDMVDLGRWKDRAVEPCVGCSWNTHFDACEIEKGSIGIGTYVH